MLSPCPGGLLGNKIGIEAPRIQGHTLYQESEYAIGSIVTEEIISSNWQI